MTFPALASIVNSEFCEVVLGPAFKSQPGYRATSRLKTAINGWTASDRTHEPHTLPCFFGCQSDDSWAHYARCPHLWHIIDIALGRQAHLCQCCFRETSTERIHNIVCNTRDIVIDNQQSIFLTRLGFLSICCKKSYLPPLIAFEVYHGLKFGALDIVEQAIASGTFDTVYSKAAALAKSTIIKFS